MFFVLFFLILSATGAYLFPDQPMSAIALGAFACVAGLRLLLLLKPKAPAGEDDKQRNR